MTRIAGSVAPGLEAVRVAFAGNFAERGEVGASLCVLLHGEPVVDLWGGFADADGARPWERDTLVNSYSAGKPLVASLVLQLVDVGALDLDAPVGSLWPEFASGGKENATVRHALTHRAGVPAIAASLTDDDLWDWDAMADALAATPAWFEPGRRVVYHTNTYGHLVGEIARRVTGAMPGTLLGAIAADLSADIHFGLGDEDLPRCATVMLSSDRSPQALPAHDDLGDDAMVMRSYFNPPGYSSFGVVNSRPWRQAQVPSTNGHGSAAGLAGFYAGLLEPDRVLSRRLFDQATRVQAEGDCPVLVCCQVDQLRNMP